VVELGWTDLLLSIVSRAELDIPGLYSDRGLEFYVWHARQWLLIGLSRGGRENPAVLRDVVPLLLKFLKEEHVLIRELSAEALRTLLAAGELQEDETGLLDCVNQPALSEQVNAGRQDFIEDEPSSLEEVLGSDEEYYFGIDIGPYWLAPLGRLFGLTEHATVRRALCALHQRMGWNGESGWQADARLKRRIFADRETSHHHGSLPQADDLRAYHGFHAMMIVAAALLQERPVRRRAEDSFHPGGRRRGAWHR
jgi:hypothetical protein